MEKHAGLRPGELKQIESGKRRPDFEQAAALSKFYDEPLNSFLYGTDLYVRPKQKDFFGLEWPFSQFAQNMLYGLIELQDKLA